MAGPGGGGMLQKAAPHHTALRQHILHRSRGMMEQAQAPMYPQGPPMAAGGPQPPGGPPMGHPMGQPQGEYADP